MIGNINGIIDKVASRKLGVTGMVEITWPIAAIAMAYIAGPTVVDTWAELDAVGGKRSGEAAISFTAPIQFYFY